MKAPRLRCRTGHNLARAEVLACPDHGRHLRYECPMYLGNRRCGDVVFVPPLGDCADRLSPQNSDMANR